MLLETSPLLALIAPDLGPLAFPNPGRKTKRMGTTPLRRPTRWDGDARARSLQRTGVGLHPDERCPALMSPAGSSSRCRAGAGAREAPNDCPYSQITKRRLRQLPSEL